eukprot:CAMPEP_0170622546 /NCGR_PEP_ID=MMETSP0224-20130122/29192_1 /TAXON_ID=285029 /ORGANISM="Togula jolla, Strain CCCM 725" /LENGTH=125 /DNA_ID=CAMNT_0010948879 /DNA_START=234 /DNA_END=611 /DNA_ORIENTATION=-
MEEKVLALPEDLAKGVVVHGPQRSLRLSLANELVNLRRCEVRLLPEVQLGRYLELSAMRLQSLGDGLWAAGVDLMLQWPSAPEEVLVVSTKNFTKPLKLLRTLVDAAELERTAGGLVVYILKPGI